MKRIDIARRAGRSLRQAKARTLLTSLAIAVGAFTLTISIAAGQGSREYADKLIGSNINPRALFIVKDKSLFGGGEQQAGLREYNPDSTTTRTGAQIKQMTQDDVQKLQKRSDLENVQPIYQLSVQYFRFQGSDKKYISDVVRYDASIRNETAAGNLPQLSADINDTEVIVPDSFAETLVKDGVIKDNADLLGKKITFTVAKPVQQPTDAQIRQALASGDVGVIQKLTRVETKNFVYSVRALSKQSSTSLSDSPALAIASSQAKEIADYTTQGTSQFQKYTGVSALAKADTKPEDVKVSLEKAGYPTRTARDLQNLLFTIVSILQGIVAGFGVLALLASVFGIINTQYISVLERTSQIGLMKALGMRRRDVAKLFRYEAAWIGFLGGMIGAGIAWAAGTALNPWITKQLSLGDGNYILIFQPLPIALLIVALMAVAVIAGYFPSRKAAKLDPIEALRTE